MWGCTVSAYYNTNGICVVCTKQNLSSNINGDHMYTFLITEPGVFLAKHIILNLSLCLYYWWCPLHMPNKHSVINVCHFIYRGMVHHTCLIWNISTWINILALQRHLYKVNASLSCLFIHAWLYQSNNGIFLLRMDHHLDSFQIWKVGSLGCYGNPPKIINNKQLYHRFTRILLSHVV